MRAYSSPVFNQIDAKDLIGTLRKTEGGIGGFLFNADKAIHSRYGFSDAAIDEITIELARAKRVSDVEDRALELRIIQRILESKAGKARNEVLKAASHEGAHASMKV